MRHEKESDSMKRIHVHPNGDESAYGAPVVLNCELSLLRDAS
jgi:hypothetical protein